MERKLWPVLYRQLHRNAGGFHQKYVQYSPWVIAAILLWAALHDRPIRWACEKRNWSSTRLRPLYLPDQSTVSRRMRKTAFGCFLNELTRQLQGEGLPGLMLSVDGKPLLVGGCSKDREARFGRAAGHIGRGYKLHVFWGHRPLPEAWTITALADHEAGVAGRLLDQLPGGGYLLADGNYDATQLFDQAGQHGYQLVAAQRDRNPGTGHHYQSPFRLRCIAMLRQPFGRALLAHRITVERFFGNATSFAGGLAPLPAWVRRRHRVELWVCAKLLINAVRIRQHQRQGLTA